MKKGGKFKLEKAGTMRIRQDSQVINIGDFCNECGNCTTFCPTNGAPYKQKPKFYLTDASFKAEQNGYHWHEQTLKARFDGVDASLKEDQGKLVYQCGPVKAWLNKGSFKVERLEGKPEKASRISLEPAVKMALLYTALKDACFI